MPVVRRGQPLAVPAAAGLAVPRDERAVSAFVLHVCVEVSVGPGAYQVWYLCDVAPGRWFRRQPWGKGLVNTCLWCTVADWRDRKEAR